MNRNGKQKTPRVHSTKKYIDRAYTGNDPETFRDYGTVGLIVARLKGKELSAAESGRQYTKGNTSIVSGPIVVLQGSRQCLALLQTTTR